jgi:hypothetical protein
MAKKTTTAKPATKKPAAKSTAKKTTTIKSATKPAAKKVAAKPAAKPEVKKATEISVSGNKKIDTLQKEFNKKFPYLQLCVFYSYMRNESSKTQLPEDKTLSSVRRADTGGDISISGNKKIKSLEKEFDTVFGLYAQVCYYNSEGKGYYTSGSDDEKTLASFNAECEAKGCLKGKYR